MGGRVLRNSRWQLGVLMCGALLVMITSSARAVGDDIALTAISHTALPGGQLQINIRSSAPLPQPSVFRTSAPDRIILDFFGVASALTSPVIDVGSGAVESVMVAQTEQRSRVVINLIAPVAYESVLDLDGLTLVIDQALVAVDAAQATPGPADSNSAGSVRHSGGQVGLVDFRRSPDGAGWVILELDIDDARINVREHLGEIVLDIDDASLDASLERRLDVIDFATPVHYVDAFSTGTGVRVVVTPRGSFDFVSVQSGKRFTLEVSDKPPAGDEDLEAVTYAGKTISFDFQNIAVRSALQQIAQETGLNFVISDSVTGDMSLRLQDVPWDQALDTIMQTKGLARREHGNVVWIAPAEEIANQERLTLEASRQVSELEPLVSDLIQVNYAKAEDIANLLKSVRAVEPNVQQSMFGNVSVAEVQTEENRLLSDRGSVTVDSRTNSLLIQDTAQKIREIRKLISELDRPVKQVLI